MQQRNWNDFDYWKMIDENNGGSLESPFGSEPLTRKSIYFWNQMGTPLPSGSLNGEWGCFPEQKALVGFLNKGSSPLLAYYKRDAH